MVENAVRHGISKRPDASGTVKISSFETENDYVIRIADDGAGYHPAPEPDGKKHVGIANARTRLTLLCAGELCELLWDDSTTSQYLYEKNENYLSQLFTDLRHTLEECSAQDVLKKTVDGYAVCMSLVKLY